MSEPPPETPTQAARALIGWFAGGLAFQSVEKFANGSLSSAIGYGLAAVIVAIGDYKLKWVLSKSPRLTKTLNALASNALLWVIVGMLSLLLITLSPFIEQRRWPFAVWFQEGTKHDQATQELSAVVAQLEAAKAQINKLKDKERFKQMATSNSSLIGLVLLSYDGYSLTVSEKDNINDITISKAMRLSGTYKLKFVLAGENGPFDAIVEYIGGANLLAITEPVPANYSVADDGEGKNYLVINLGGLSNTGFQPQTILVKVLKKRSY